MPPAIVSSRFRPLIVVALLFGFSFASYVERVNLSVASELMMPALALSKSQLALIFNSFLFGYALFQVPMGWLGDRFGARRVLGVSALLWGVLTVGTGLLPGVVARSAAGVVLTLWALRFLLGAAEASTYPVCARAVQQWMSPSRRGTANSVMLMGSSVGSAVTAPFVAWSMVRYGWRASFYLTAAVAFAVALLWFAFTRGARPPFALLPATEPSERRSWLSRNAVLLSLSYFSEGYLLFTFVSWLYIYLVEVRGFSLAAGGLVSSLPWITAMAATPLGGILSDTLAARFGRASSAQSLISVGYSLSGILLLVAASVHRRSFAVLALCASLGFMYLAESSFWTTAAQVAGDHASRVSGFMNCIGILGGVVSNFAIPELVKRFGLAGWSFAFSIGTALGLGTAMVWWVLGRRLRASQSQEFVSLP